MKTPDHRIALVAALTCCLAAGTASAAAVPISQRQIDDTVARTMKAFQVPGVAVGIVKDGKVVMAKGYGVRQAGKSDPVGAQTVYQIGSNTKAFTAAALAILVDEGKISWDDKVIDHLPDFRMYDPYVTREFTIRDLLTHRSGLSEGAGDLMFYPATDFSRDEIVHGLRYLKPTSSFRSEYDYENVLYIVAGQIIPAVTHQSWEDFVQTRILTPLGMTGCAPNQKRVPPQASQASPHQIADGKPTVITPEALDVIGPAGAINCNVDGMNAWLQTQLAEGKSPTGVQLFSAERSQEMWSAITPQPLNGLAALTGTNFKAYGLGWEVSDEFGYKRVSHTGGVPGVSTWVAMIPQLRLGVVVVTNLESPFAMNAIGNQILDAYVGAPTRDWVDTVTSIAKTMAEPAEAADQNLARAIAENRLAAQPLDAYAGRYTDPWRGEATVRRDGERLVLKISRTRDLEGALIPLGGDMFVVRWNRRGMKADAYVRFTPKFGGGVEGMKLQPVSPTTDTSFDFHDLDFTKAASAAVAEATVK